MIIKYISSWTVTVSPLPVKLGSCETSVYCDCEIIMQNVKNFIQGKALGVAEYLTPVLKVYATKCVLLRFFSLVYCRIVKLVSSSATGTACGTGTATATGTALPQARARHRRDHRQLSGSV